MSGCIYYGQMNRNLTFRKREHIIPAAIGGQRTLPLGYVSDQANNFLSKYELACVRSSPLFNARAKMGPGKRGSFDIGKIEEPDVLSLEPMERDGSSYVCPLGFLFMGKAYVIPQIVVIFDNEAQRFVTTQISSNSPNVFDLSKTSFETALQKLFQSPQKRFHKIPIPHKTEKLFVCIGWHKKGWYFSSTIPGLSTDDILEKVTYALLSEKASASHLGFSLSTSAFRYQREISLENMAPTFLHAKNCFNTLAFFKGKDFVQCNNFNQFRECILSNSDWEKVLLSSKCTPQKLIQWIAENVHSHEHLVAIYTQFSNIMAFSLLYGSSWGLFRLGTEYASSPFSCALLCDFEHGQETYIDSLPI